MTNRTGPHRLQQKATIVSTPALQFIDVVKSYGSGSTEVRAVTDVTLTIDPGEFVAVMGPSGCGKSTLLHLGGALEVPSAGRVLVGGRDLAEMTVAEQADMRRRDVGYVFQSLNLIPALTAVENVMLPLELDGIGARQARSIAQSTLQPVGLGRDDVRPLDRVGRLHGDLVDPLGAVVLEFDAREGLSFTGFDEVGVDDDARIAVHENFESDLDLVQIE